MGISADDPRPGLTHTYARVQLTRERSRLNWFIGIYAERIERTNEPNER